MKKIPIILFLILISGVIVAQNAAPRYRMIIKGGHVIDPKNNIDGIMDVAIQDGKIAKVAKDIDTSFARQIVHANGMYVTPGLIDIHAHVFYGVEPERYLSNSFMAPRPDGFTFRSGVTTVVDAGGAGWKSFDKLKKNVIDQSRTRVLSFLNIVGEGMRGGYWEEDIGDMAIEMAANTALENKEHIVGFMLSHPKKADWIPVQKVVKAGKLADMPVMVDLGEAKLPIEDLFSKYLRPGDIYTHVFAELEGRDPVVDLRTRQLKQFIIPAQNRGIIFDLGFGSSHFDFRQAMPAIKAGFLPNTMGTNLYSGSMNGAMKDELNVLSTFLAMGLNLPQVISRSTWEPAQAIKREDLGNLSEGSVADIAVLSLRQGKFGFRDTAGKRLAGAQRLECQLTIKGGQVVYDLNAIAVFRWRNR